MRRQIVAVVVASLALSGTSYAQGVPRLELGLLVRVDNVRVEGDLVSPVRVAGLAVSQRLLKSMSIEAEITWATGTLRRHYTGEFVSSAPSARRDLSYMPGWGGAAALVWRGAVSPRVDVGFKAGLSGRSYVETSTFTILTTPSAVDPVWLAHVLVDTRGRRSRGGLLLAVDAPVRVSSRVRVIPEVRLVIGPRQVGNAHREWGVGLRGVWGL